MSVINCSKCGHEVSTFAPFCPECKRRENIGKPITQKPEIDNGFKATGRPMRRFYLNRIKDQTGVSRTGRVLEGVLCQDGQVIIQWRPPLTSIAIYKDWETFMVIHVRCHPSCNEVVFLDPDEVCLVCKGEGVTPCNDPTTGCPAQETCFTCKGRGIRWSREEAKVIRV